MTDSNVFGLYYKVVAKSLGAHGEVAHFALNPGEEAKSVLNLEELYNWALSNGIDRNSSVVALGGGVVGDIAGHFAATILRGVPLIQIPTTITSQVDSSIGGKTGVNHARGKNLIGSFYPPRLVYCDVGTISTLSKRDFLSGMAEVVKHAYLCDLPSADRLVTNTTSALKTNEVSEQLVRDAALTKIQIVQADEFESGVRAFLNFGHTFGHAIERATNYTTFTHGEAVALGMRAALVWSAERGGTASSHMSDLLLEKMNLNYGHIPSAEILVESMGTDKKFRDGSQVFVLLGSEGNPYLHEETTAAQVVNVIQSSYGNIGS